MRWITRDITLAAHTRGLTYGGVDGVREEGMLMSALARPQNLAAYEKPSTFALAATLAYGLAKNHPFIDGNKRTAFLCAYVFLGLNGAVLDADEDETTSTMVDFAAGKLTEVQFASWLEANCKAA